MVKLPGQHPDCQRQVSAQPGDLADSWVVGLEPSSCGKSYQQPGGVLLRHRVQVYGRGVF
ncbi:MAG TPA: hypothetical protein VJT16_20840 [Streptosporangiaceae bacterium]|nr:hypothetical protein [Streptosporangiaceae bacterium]